MVLWIYAYAQTHQLAHIKYVHSLYDKYTSVKLLKIPTYCLANGLLYLHQMVSDFYCKQRNYSIRFTEYKSQLQ